ncbi:cyd operon protein YbgE [Vibrio hannami]|uniref:cyd operon protein YbgE n=1 Tax=Vibrio hannami TaxID=2717094 RepID=UPI00240F4423|nr:cyd operon protein YbgE [Vibrio hannami]MDG3087716.1 cyd operon protein YbgE [Vibrio hannami]
MSNLATKVAEIHRPVERALFRALSILMVFMHAGLVLWEPTQYAQAIGGFNTVISPLMIWAICTGVIFGVGFTPINWYWRVLFSPYISLLVLGYLTFLYFFV